MNSRVEPFSRYELFKRDKGICQICKQPIDLSLSYPSQLAFTVDHIIPISKGGEHSLANCQCAHAICNTMKGNEVETAQEQPQEPRKTTHRVLRGGIAPLGVKR